MGNPPSLSFTFAFILCFSFYASCTLAISHQQSEYQTQSLDSTPKATIDDLLNVLGTYGEASSVDQKVAEQLRSCFKHLVPPPQGTGSSILINASHPIKMVTSNSGTTGDEIEDDENARIWLPPNSVEEVARDAAVSSPRRMWNLLTSTYSEIPDIEGSKEADCHDEFSFIAHRFRDEELNKYMEFLFNLIVKRGPRIGLNVTLSRFDLYHGHLFQSTTNSRLGILFQAKEYPSKDAKFPVDLGPCQTGSSVKCDASEMNLRNILWLAPYTNGATRLPGALLIMDARPDGIIYRDLIREENHLRRTICEDDFGFVSIDVTYVNVGKPGKPDYRVYLCS